MRGGVEVGREQPQQLEGAEGEQAGAAEPYRELEAPGFGAAQRHHGPPDQPAGQQQERQRESGTTRSSSPTIGGGHSGATVQK